MKTLILSTFLVFSLTACGTQKPFIDQQNLLVKCQELPDLKGTTGRDVLDTMTTWGSMYAQCKERHSALVDAVENIKQ